MADEDEEFGLQIDEDLKNLASNSVKSAGIFDLGGLAPDLDTEEEDLERQPEPVSEKQREFQEFNSMFDNIALLDDDNDDDENLLDQAQVDEDEEFTLQELEQIKNDFPGVNVDENNFLIQDEEQIDNEGPNISSSMEVVYNKQMARSVYVPQKSEGNDLLKVEVNPEF